MGQLKVDNNFPSAKSNLSLCNVFFKQVIKFVYFDGKLNVKKFGNTVKFVCVEILNIL